MFGVPLTFDEKDIMRCEEFEKILNETEKLPDRKPKPELLQKRDWTKMEMMDLWHSSAKS